MGWIGLWDRDGGRFSPSGLAGQVPNNPKSVLSRGTLILETQVAGDDRPHDLMSYTQPHPDPMELAFRAVPGGGIAMVHKGQGILNHAAIPWTGAGQIAVLRLAYVWDYERALAYLAVQYPDHDNPKTRDLSHPMPIPAEVIRNLVLRDARRTVSPEVRFFAVSTKVEPIGPLPTMHPDTPVATPFGYRRIGDLRRGDTVISSSGTVVPVLHAVSHVLPARGSFTPVRLHAPYFGLQRDIVVAPEQRLVLQGSEVEYLFDQEAVLVPARHLVNGHAARFCAPASTMTYAQVILPGHETLIAAGCALESLYIGRIRRDPVRLAASVLRNVARNSLPEHGRPIHQVLRPFEAVTLIDQRAA